MSPAAFICKTPGCGNDLTETVLRLAFGPTGRYEMRSGVGAVPKPDPVVVTCAKCKATYEYA